MEIMAGKNIAIKVPLHRCDETVGFYRDRVGLPVKKEMKSSGFSLILVCRRYPGNHGVLYRTAIHQPRCGQRLLAVADAAV